MYLANLDIDPKGFKMMDYYNNCDSNNNLLMGCGSNNVSSTIDIGMMKSVHEFFWLQISRN